MVLTTQAPLGNCQKTKTKQKKCHRSLNVWHSYATFWVLKKIEVHPNVYMKHINDVLVYGQSLLMSNCLELLVKLKIYLFAKFDMTNFKLTHY